jgi:tetratricopeptide (TPR) repeat protein
LAISLGRLSTLYAAAGRYDEADKLAKRALELWPKDKKGEPRYVRAARLVLLMNSADISRIRRQQDAADTYRRALELIQQDSNFEFPGKVRLLNGLSQVYLAEGNLGQADVNLSEAERIEAKNAFALRSPEAATTHYVRAAIHRGAKKFAAAEEEFRVALDIGLEAFGEDGPFVLHSELALARFLDDLGRGSEATSYKEDAQRIRETLTKAGCNHEDLAAAISQPPN